MRDIRQHEAHQITREQYLNEKAAECFPVQWSRALKSGNVSKRKARLRKRYLDKLAYDAWRADHPNVTCATCASCSDLPDTFTEEKYEGLKSCDYGEGNGWYRPVDPKAYFCMKWEAA